MASCPLNCELSIQHLWASISAGVTSGYLLSYIPNVLVTRRRAAEMAAKILDGANRLICLWSNHVPSSWLST
jgi:hypothetical protein